MDDMKKCPHCGTENDQVATMCKQCNKLMDTGNGTDGVSEGTPVAGVEEDEAETPTM